MDISKATPDGTDDGECGVTDDGDNRYVSGTVRRRTLSLREAINELTQLRMVRAIIWYYTEYRNYKNKSRIKCVERKCFSPKIK